jgi:peptidoglycan/LPS O-acetylase OafA/YrhL
MLIAIASVPQVINHNHLEPLQVAMSFLMIAWPDPEGRIAPLLNLGWTLNLEVYFYGVFAIALLAREGLAVTLLAAYFSMTVALASLWSEAGWPLRFYGKPIVLEFVFGIMLSTLFARGLRVKLRAAVIVGIFAVLLHVILWNLSGWLNTGRVIENGLPACLLFFACVFAETAPFSPPAAAFLRLMGDSSYALYLTSPFAINLSAEVLSGRGVNDPMTIVAAVFIISTLVAVAVHRLVELPITRFGRRLLARRQQKVLANLPPPATASVRGQPVA